jgi:thymidine kinase
MSLTCFCGPMWSSKTSHLLKEITMYSDLSKEKCVLVINHSLDNRDIKNTISSHSSIYQGLNNKIDAISSSSLRNVDVSKYSIIAVDEAQFFSDLVETIKLWLDMGKHIICCGLDGNSNMGKFGHISDLVHLADKFVKLTAVCTLCMAETNAKGEIITPCNIVPAPFTKKIIEGNNEIDVGGSEKYIAVCRKHHISTK